MLPRGFLGREGKATHRAGLEIGSRNQENFLMDLSKLGKILCICYFQGFIFFETVSRAPLEFGNFCPYKSEQVIIPDDVWCWL